MQLIENLFVGESVGNLGTVVYSLKRDIPVFRLYCLVYFADRNRIEILSSKAVHKEIPQPQRHHCRCCHGAA